MVVLMLIKELQRKTKYHILLHSLYRHWGTIDDIHNPNFADLNLGVGIGPRGAAEVYFMDGESDPNGEFSITGNGSCSAALDIGLGIGLGFPPKSGSIGGVAGLGFECSANLSFNIPLPAN